MILYVDNYKGFTDTFIPIKNVNFFVGENSSGKTSILKLLEVMSSNSFWFNPEFNNSEIELGYFSEIVNQAAADKSYFSIGIYYDEEKQEDKYNGFIWLKFKEEDSTPVISEFKFISNNKSIWCYSAKDNVIKYRTKHIEQGIPFADWIHDFDGFEDAECIKPSFGKNLPFGILCSILEECANGLEQSSTHGLRMPLPYNRFIWIAPIRAKAKRWYESYKLSYSSEGEHIPLLLRKTLSGTTTKVKNFVESMNYFGQESGLYDSIEIKDGKKDAPFAMYVNYGKLSVNITNVGYGVSQVLPLVVELLTSNKDSFAIQQPEVHLHPKAQAAFGEFIFKVATENKNRLILETHSEYMINRFRHAVSNSRKKTESQILLFKRDSEGSHVFEIPINSKGKMEGDYICDYLEFFMDEELKLMEI